MSAPRREDYDNLISDLSKRVERLERSLQMALQKSWMPLSYLAVDHTLDLGDAGATLEVSNTSPTAPVNITVPPHSDVPFKIGDCVRFIRMSGPVHILAGAGVAVQSRIDGAADISLRLSQAVIYQRDIDDWVFLSSGAERFAD